MKSNHANDLAREKEGFEPNTPGIQRVCVTREMIKDGWQRGRELRARAFRLTLDRLIKRVSSS